MTRTKVLLSVSDDDLEHIDAAAKKAGMSRSEYLVAMGRHGNASVYAAIANLQDELAKFQIDQAGPLEELVRAAAQLSAEHRASTELLDALFEPIKKLGPAAKPVMQILMTFSDELTNRVEAHSKELARLGALVAKAKREHHG